MEIVSEIQDLSKGMLSKDDVFQSELIEYNPRNLPVKVRVRSKPGGLDHKPNVYIKLRIPVQYKDMYELGEEFDLNDLEHQNDFSKLINQIVKLVKENTESDKVEFKLENTNQFCIYSASVNRK